jgi:3-oxoacyl-[acyl-carrier protein] reductase
MTLKGKNIVITGCLKGIGRATLETFAKNHANIWACCQNEDQEFSEAIQKLSQQYDVTISPLYFDLNNYDQIKKAFKQITDSKQNIDGLVNIAGVTYNALLHMTSIEKIREIFEIDFHAQIYITQLISKLMMRKKSGSIVYISSFTGLDGNPGQIAYSSAKASFIGATKTLASELGKYNIRVNSIAPGAISTDMIKGLPQDKIDALVVKSKMKRLGTPEEIANVLLFLISDLSAYISGQIIRVDGGIG